MSCPGEEQLQDFLDETLSPEKQREVETHLLSCLDCAEEVEKTLSLLRRVKELPESISPGKDLWQQTRATIQSGQAEQNSRRPWFTLPKLAAVAAVVTLVAIGIRGQFFTGQLGDPAGESLSSSCDLPVNGSTMEDIQSAEAEYARAAEALQGALERRKPEMSAETYSVLAENLEVLSAATTRASSAWHDDPTNICLGHVYLSIQQRKLNLLRRAAGLPTQA